MYIYPFFRDVHQVDDLCTLIIAVRDTLLRLFLAKNLREGKENYAPRAPPLNSRIAAVYSNQTRIKLIGAH